MVEPGSRTELAEKRASLAQVARLEALGEPRMGEAKEAPRFPGLAAPPEQTREARRGA
jgi:hypothetical protein